MTVRVHYPTPRFKNAKAAAEFKRKTRRRKEWAELREAVAQRQEYLDYLTHQPLRKGWALHHLREHVDHYDDFNPDNFIAVNQAQHEYIHYLADIGEKVDVERVDEVIEKMLHFRELDYKK